MKTRVALRASQAGETIVEVLIAIAILSSSLGIAFATASRSTKGLQANQERYQGVLLANEQANLLKAVRDAGNTDIRKTTSFCIYLDINTYKVSSDDASTFDAKCKSRGVNNLYDITVKALDDSSVCDNSRTFCTYKIHVEWDSVKQCSNPDSTQCRDSVEIYYGI